MTHPRDLATDATTAAKIQLRRSLLKQRRSLDHERWRCWSERLTEALLHHPIWATAGTVAGFRGIRKEPDTRALLQAAIDGGRRLFMPKVLSEQPPLLGWAEVEQLDRMERGRFSLIEPPSARPHDLSTIDLVLVPGIAFGRHGQRLGYGKAFYDIALEPFRNASTPISVGVCFDMFLEPQAIPVSLHDVPVDYVVTESGVIRCESPLEKS